MTPTRHLLQSRSAGILLHPSSLPGPYGIGDLGPAAHDWIDALSAAGQSWWQILPLGPTGYGDSPYQCFSAFAGNPNLISPEALVADRLIFPEEVAEFELPADTIDYGRVGPKKRFLVERAWERFRWDEPAGLVDEWQQFRSTRAGWLDDFAEFMTLKQAHGGRSWLEWPEPARLRDSRSLAEARTAMEPVADVHRFAQFLFFRQWNRLHAHARTKGIRIIGDMPIFLAEDSADVWAHPELFRLDDDRRPVAVAGVPPDYFSTTGQLWGNPLYDWPVHEKSNYAWWIERMRAALDQVDLIRLDHFRGFEAYWEVPAGSATAQLGRWVPGPRGNLLCALRDAIGSLPLIAEDLGVITPEVDTLRISYNLPGMKILQFAFGGAVESRFLPHNFEDFTVVYTGTHDNDTTRGWFEKLTADERAFATRYLNTDGSNITWDLIREAWKSVAVLAVTPAQDLLDLGPSARMNLPGRASGNWRWRLKSSLDPATIDRLADLTALYQRARATAEGRTAS